MYIICQFSDHLLQCVRLLGLSCLILVGIWLGQRRDCQRLVKDLLSQNPRDTYFPVQIQHNQTMNWTQAVVGYPPPYQGLCSFEICSLINHGRTPVKYMPRDPGAVCTAVHQCVTLITKTRYRLSNVANLITSLHRYYPGTRVIVADDFNPSYPANAPDAWLCVYGEGRDGLITYIQVEEGISNGRNTALHLATTEYVLVVDDDHVFTNESDLFALLRVLQHTDTTLAAGQFGEYRFDALVRATPVNTSSVHLIWYPYIFYQSLQPVADCYVTDRVQNFFLAKREDLLDTGGWDNQRKIFEHVDFFLTLRKHCKKVVYCPGVKLHHDQTDSALHDDRKNVSETYQEMLQEKWKFSESYLCKPDTYFILDHCEKRMKPPWNNYAKKRRKSWAREAKKKNSTIS